ncbi:alpha/beta hydrolase [Pseudomonas sp. 10-1B]|uniref:alpha/beta fold hydrolase n=1 Tax=Pseudomonas sp. 10-1B TaxID=1546029 RepID=UPI00061FC00E|nr:alpha/beta hydrolase [Pseudomonas sp. 10-1B]KIY38401.1 alpha/beta hydrolase [Pseudomonas sp. 10-1B]
MHWIEVNQVALRFQHLPAQAPTLILLHEMGGSLESWDLVVARLAGQFNILRYDTRGAGLSEKVSDSITLDEHVADLEQLLTALELDGPVAIAGVAVGAAIAIRFAARHQQRVSHLIALSPACGVAEQAREATLNCAANVRQLGVRAVIPGFLERTWPPALRTDSLLFDAFSRRWLSADPACFAATLTMLAHMDLHTELKQLPPRSLLVAGEHDALRPPAEIDRLARFAGHLEALHVASGHFMPMQSPLWVSTLLRHYILGCHSGAQIYREFMDCPEHQISSSRHAA